MPIDAEVLLEFENFGGFIREVSANISNGGMFIKTRYLKPIGTVVHFQFRLADHMELIRGTGTVVWTRWRDQGPGAPAGMGIQFLDVDEPSQLLIAAIVEQHLQHGGAVFDLGTAAGEGGQPPADPGNWGAAARAEGAEDRLPEIDFGALPGFEPGAPASSAGWTAASQPEGGTPSEAGLPAVAEAVSPSVAAAG
ncbi:MAG: TIGR02266 family protein, partial [Acidobacteriota bacterium]